MTLIVMFAIWIVIGLLMGILAGSIWKGNRPLGEQGDYLLAIAFAVIIGLGDWYVLPLIGIDGAVKFAAAVVEPPLGALLALWLARRLKKQPT